LGANCRGTTRQKVIFRLFFPSASKRVLEQYLSYESKFDLHENEPVGGTHFHMNGFTEAKANSKMTY